jgi:hypothetical protein
VRWWVSQPLSEPDENPPDLCISFRQRWRRAARRRAEKLPREGVGPARSVRRAGDDEGAPAAGPQMAGRVEDAAPVSLSSGGTGRFRQAAVGVRALARKMMNERGIWTGPRLSAQLAGVIVLGDLIPQH